MLSSEYTPAFPTEYLFYRASSKTLKIVMKKKRKSSIQVQIRKRIEANKEHAVLAGRGLSNPKLSKHHDGYAQSLGIANRRLATIINVAYKRVEKGDKRMKRILKRIGMG